MGIPQSLFESFQAPSAAEAEALSALPKPVKASPPEETAVGGVVRTGAKGFGAATGRNFEVARGVQMGELWPTAILRAFLPGEWVDFVSPQARVPMVNEKGEVKKRGALLREASGLTPENLGDIAATRAGEIYNKLGGKTSESPDIGPATGPFNKGFRTMADFAGQALAQPMTGVANLPKYLMGAAGAGAGAEVGGAVAKNSARAMGASEDTAHLFEVAGSLPGAIAGGQANLIRYNTAKEAVKGPGKIAENVANAWKEARAKQQAGDSRNIFQLFMDSDSLKNVRAESSGVLRQHVNEQVARDIQMDPNAQGNIEAFKDAAAKAGVDTTSFNTAQKTGTPSLVGTVAQMRPAVPEDVSKLTLADQLPKDELRRAYRQITSNTVPPDAKSVLASLRELQKTAELRITGLNLEAGKVAAETPALSASERITQGASLREAAETELAAAKVEKDRLYQLPKTHDEAAQTPYDLSEVVKKAGAQLKETFSNIDPKAVPESVRNLRRIFGGKVADPAMEELTKNMTPEDLKAFQVEHGIDPGKRVAYSDISDTLQALNQDAQLARIRGQAGNPSARREEANLREIQTSLEAAFAGQAPPEVLEAHNAAVKHFRENFVPRFREGVNANLFREAGAARQGENYIAEGAEINTFLKKDTNVPEISETRLREFDNLFGGVKPGTTRNSAMYGELWRGVEDHYSSQVLQKSLKNGFDEAAHEKFMKEYAPAFDRMPALRDKIEANADRIASFQEEAKRVAENYSVVAGSPLTAQLGSQAASLAFSRALADPAAMGRLLKALPKGAEEGERQGAKALLREVMLKAQPWKEMPDGPVFDKTNLLKILDAGRNVENPNAPGGLQVLLNAALGKVEGKAHYERLRALALLSERVEATTPQFLRPQDPFPADPIKAATGSSPASMLSDAKALVQGRVSPLYLAGITGGRFFNTRIRAAVNKAYQDALFDPEASKAVLELATTPANGAASITAAKRVFGSAGEAGVDFIKRLTEHGQITKYGARSALLAGTVEANKGQNEEGNREVVPGEPAINR